MPTPLTLQTAPAGNGEVQLTWNGGTRGTTRTLERRVGDNGPFAPIAQIPASATSHIDRELQAFTTYCYRFAGADSATIACRRTEGGTPRTLAVLGLGRVTGRYTTELTVFGSYAYTGTYPTGALQGDVIYVWNVSGPAPQLVDSVTVPESRIIGDLQVSDDGRLLVAAIHPIGSAANVALIIYSLTNPGRPQRIAVHATANTVGGAHTAEVARVNARLYAFLAITARRNLVIVDITEPETPREVASCCAGSPYTHDTFVRDGLLFTAQWNNGTGIWDIGGGARGGSNAAPVQLSVTPTVGGSVHNLWWLHDQVTGSKRYVLVGEEEEQGFRVGGPASGDLHILDIANMAAPREVAYYRADVGGSHNYWVDERNGILYAAFYDGGIRAIDVRGDLGTCTAQQRDPDGRCNLARMGREVAQGLRSNGPVFVWGTVLAGTRLYAADMLNGLWVLDVTPIQR